MNIFAKATLISSIVSCLISIYALRFRKTKGALSFSALVFAVSLYALGYTFELVGSNVEDFRFGLYIEYLGIPFIPFFWLIFTIQFVGKQKWLNWKLITPLLSISVIIFVLNYTNEFHHLYYKDIRLDDSGPFPIALLIKGPWYWVNIAYINIAILVGNILLIEMLVKTSPIYRKQVIIMILGSLCPWIGHIVYQMGLGPHGLDVSPVATSLAGVFYALGLFRFRMLDLFPIALENVFESIKGSIIIIDNYKRIIELNMPAKSLITKYNDNPLGKFLDKDFAVFSERIEMFFNDKPKRVLSLDNEAKFFNVNVSTIKNRRKQQLGYVIILNDITEQKNIENALRANEIELTELNATKDKFFNLIAHDLKNPFNTIVGLSGHLVRSLENNDGEDLKRISSLILGASKKGYKLLENLLDWARSQTGRIEFTPGKEKLCSLVSESINSIENFAEDKEISIKNKVDYRLTVFVDNEMIKVVLRNLLTNAIKFTHRKGEIIISTIEEDNMVSLSVKDNGVGISKEDLDKLFRIEYFQNNRGTEDETGTGLGLLVCKEFIEKNKGQISVKSKINNGSEFTITIPKA